jgi:hypothetical protein
LDLDASPSPSIADRRDIPEPGVDISDLPAPPPSPNADDQVGSIYKILDWLCAENTSRYESLCDLHTNLISVGKSVVNLSQGLETIFSQGGLIHTSFSSLKDSQYDNANTIYSLMSTRCPERTNIPTNKKNPTS